MNAPDTTDSEPVELHHGHDPETGVVSRVREWTDIFPWLRLGRVLRLAGSPPSLVVVAIALLLWSLILEGLGVQPLDRPAQSLLGLHAADSGIDEDASFTESFQLGLLPMNGGLPSRLVDSVFPNQAARFHWAARLLVCVISLLIWTPVLLLLLRQGALLTAGRDMAGLSGSLKFVLRRTPPAWLAAFIPLICVALLAVPMLLAGWLDYVLGGLGFLSWPLSIVVALLAIPCGLLAFGANFAVPLSWAAIINEAVPDPLDALSRGYEYLYRRPLQLVLYAFLSAVTLWVVTLLAVGISGSALAIAERCLGNGLTVVSGSAAELADDRNISSQLTGYTAMFLASLPIVVAITLFWGLLGGVYLLLRRDAGGQEVEDLWLAPPAPAEPLPSLPVNPRNDL